MKRKIYELFDTAISYGLDNSCFGLCRDIETKSYFGSSESMEISGQYLYVYSEEDGMSPFSSEIFTADVVLTVEDQRVYLYYLGQDE